MQISIPPFLYPTPCSCSLVLLSAVNHAGRLLITGKPKLEHGVGSRNIVARCTASRKRAPARASPRRPVPFGLDLAATPFTSGTPNLSCGGKREALIYLLGYKGMAAVCMVRRRRPHDNTSNKSVFHNIFQHSTFNGGFLKQRLEKLSPEAFYFQELESSYSPKWQSRKHAFTKSTFLHGWFKYVLSS